MFETLKGKRALVTGGSRGIGRAISLALAKEGCDITVIYGGNDEAARSTLEELLSLGVSARAYRCDLTDPISLEALPGEAFDVDIAVLNASVQIRKTWTDITPEEAQTQLNCNFVSSFRILQKCVPYMKREHWGRILTIGSVQEKKPHPDMLIYSASKAAQTNLTLSLAGQLARDGITVNNLAPGVIYTDRNREALSDAAYAQKVTDSIPMGYYGLPEDMASLAVLLVSDEGRYITGQSVYADGGKSL